VEVDCLTIGGAEGAADYVRKGGDHITDEISNFSAILDRVKRGSDDDNLARGTEAVARALDDLRHGETVKTELIERMPFRHEVAFVNR